MAMSRRIELYFPTKSDDTYEVVFEGVSYKDKNKMKCVSRAMKAIRKDIMLSLGTRKELKKIGYFD